MLKNNESVKIKKQHEPKYKSDNGSEDETEKLHIEAMKKLLTEHGVTIKKDVKEDNELILINLSQYEGIEIPERNWVIKDWLPRGHLSVLRGKRGIGKTGFLRQLATALATGKPFMGNETEARRIYIVTRENADMWTMQANLDEHYGAGREDVVNIRFMLCQNSNNKLMTFMHSATGELTEFHGRLHKDIMEYKPDLVILDCADDFFAGNEASHQQVRRFIQNACGRIACDADAAVLLCVHDDTGNPEHASYWYHIPRSSWYLRQKDEIDGCSYILKRVKSNYAKSGEELLLYYTDGIFSLAETVTPAGTEETDY